jgi:hypothetical protein
MGVGLRTHCKKIVTKFQEGLPDKGMNAYRILVASQKERDQQGRSSLRWVNNIKMDLSWDGDVGWMIWLRIGTSGGLL